MESNLINKYETLTAIELLVPKMVEFAIKQDMVNYNSLVGCFKECLLELYKEGISEINPNVAKKAMNTIGF